MRAAPGLTIPTGLDQPLERIKGARHRGVVLTRPAGGVLPVVFPLGEQRIAMGGQRSLEHRRFRVSQPDPPQVEPVLTAGLADRGDRIRPRIWIGAGFETHRGAQLAESLSGILCKSEMGLLRNVF